MQVVDHHGVGVKLAMLGQMRVAWWKFRVVMRKDCLVVRGPEVPHGGKACGADDGQTDGRHRKSSSRADPSGKWIGDQPARMRKCELRGKDRTPVGLAR